MASTPLPRREALRHLLVLSAAAAFPAAFATACGKKGPSCNDAPGLSAEEQSMRTQTAAYVEQTPNPAQRCDGCAQWTPAAPDQCGGCKVVKGPINPAGWCKLWVAKPA